MKRLFKIALFSLSILLTFNSCIDDYIDGITEVDPGNDAGAPVVNIIYPTQGGIINDLTPVIPITLKFNVTDDIELESVTALIDGTEILFVDSFLDYRNYIVDDLVYASLATGTHTFTVTGKDKVGNVTTQSVTFEKPPYTPVFANESLYMPFDANFYDVITETLADVVGSPSFLGKGKIGSDSYVPGEGNYISFPSANLMTPEFSASFWYKVDATASRAGIITIGPNETDRTQGFRLFREGGATSQTIKLNVGTGAGESWNNGGSVAVDDEWVHIAFTISATESVVYIDGVPVNTATLSAPLDWTGCTAFSIGSGEPTFAYWNHLSDTSAIDDLRFFSTALSAEEVQAINDSAYEPEIDGETLFMNFEGNYMNLDSGTAAAEVGSPTFAGEGYEGANAYLGVTDSYLTYPIDGLFGTNSFTATFWYKVNADPTRAGILVVGDNADDRMQGFRLFREGSATSQRIKLNVGTGSGESWNDGGLIDPSAGNWVHIAVTVSSTESKIYFGGVLQNSATFGNPIDWTDCTDMVIGSGGPTFGYWNHFSDLSEIDNLRIFNRVLTVDEIQSML